MVHKATSSSGYLVSQLSFERGTHNHQAAASNTFVDFSRGKVSSCFIFFFFFLLLFIFEKTTEMAEVNKAGLDCHFISLCNIMSH